MNDTPYRYTAELAERIEARWQDRWESEGTFHAPNPAGPWADPEGVAGAAEAVRPGHVPLPLRRRAARRPPAGLHRHRRLRPLPADDRQERAALPGLRRVRPARRAVRRPDRPASSQDHRGQHRHDEAPAAPAGAGPRRPAHHRDDRRRTSTAGRSGSSCRSSTRWYDESAEGGRGRARPIERAVEALLESGERPTPDGRAVVRAVEGRAARGHRRRTGWPTSPRRRSTGARVWAPCWPTRRSPPTAAPSGATSRCSSAA